MSAPACPDCEAEMQFIVGKWRCPWASVSRWGKAFGSDAPETKTVTCGWPLTVPREIAGLPNEGVTM